MPLFWTKMQTTTKTQFGCNENPMLATAEGFTEGHRRRHFAQTEKQKKGWFL